MIKGHYGHGQNGHFDNRPFGKLKVSMVMAMVMAIREVRGVTLRQETGVTLKEGE